MNPLNFNSGECQTLSESNNKVKPLSVGSHLKTE
nr:MAG TPA: hypothetical protein [Caudoviricetes sp.]